MNNRTAMQTLLLGVGAVVLLGGLVCVVSGFVGVASSDGESGGSSMALFAAGGFAMVIGLGIVAFTRAAIVAPAGGYTRVIVERGRRSGSARFCSRCGTATAPTARFCEGCGAALR